MTTFTLQLEQFAAKASARADDVVGRVVSEIARRIDDRSPVGDATYWKNPPPKGYIGGRFRGNWQLGVGSVPAGETGRIDPDGAATVGAIIAEIPTQAAGLVYFLANNVPYAQAIEDGHSRQAPTGLVGLTAVEFPSIVDQAMESVQ
jgi:hypothetical protein